MEFYNDNNIVENVNKYKYLSMLSVNGILKSASEHLA